MTWNEDLLKKSDPGTTTWNKEHQIEIDTEKQRFLDDLRAGKKIPTVRGFFGPEQRNADAYCEVIFPEEGGSYLKAYGCPFLYRGWVNRAMVFGVLWEKYMFSGFLRDGLAASFPVRVGLLFEYLFFRRAFLQRATKNLVEFNHRGIDWFPDSPDTEYLRIKDKDYNVFEKEVERALLASAGKTLWSSLVKELARFIKIVLYIDNAYKFRVQDALSDAKTFDLFGVLDILIKRERSVGESESVRLKWRFIKIAIRIALFTSPELRRIIKRFFKELDREKVRLDKDDWYFCLTFKSYDFRDMSFEERLAERERLNRENHVIFLL